MVVSVNKQKGPVAKELAGLSILRGLARPPCPANQSGQISGT